MARIGVRHLVLTLTGVAAIAVPIVLGLRIAQELAFEKYSERAGDLAAEVMRRVDAIRGQLGDAFDALEAADVTPCSERGLAVMRAVAVRMDRLAGVGFIEADALQCSAFGQHEPPVPVGSPDYRSPLLIDVRSERQLDFAPGPELLLATRPSGYTGFIHPNHAIALAEDDADTSLAVLGRISGLQLAARGRMDAAWVAETRHSEETRGVTTFDGHLVAWHHSDVWDLTAYAAVPTAVIARDAERQGRLLAPIGLLAGGALLFAGVLGVRQNRSMQSLFRAALRRNELQVHYQPIVDVGSGRWVGAEALVRWRRSSGEWVPPTIFVPIAERHGLMQALTMRVIELALAEIRPVVARDADFFVSINMGASDLTSPTIRTWLTDVIARNGLMPANVHIELTEHTVVDVGPAAAAIMLYRSGGIAVGVDDFGVGYSNLAYLEALTFDYLKIDRIFVAGADLGAPRKQTISHIIELAHGHGAWVIVEGIETEEQRAFLHDQGVRFGQGWLFADANPIAEFDRRHGRNMKGYRPPAMSNSAPVT